jgi:hypothetical protein
VLQAQPAGAPRHRHSRPRRPAGGPATTLRLSLAGGPSPLTPMTRTRRPGLQWGCSGRVPTVSESADSEVLLQSIPLTGSGTLALARPSRPARGPPGERAARREGRVRRPPAPRCARRAPLLPGAGRCRALSQWQCTHPTSFWFIRDCWIARTIDVITVRGPHGGTSVLRFI